MRRAAWCAMAILLGAATQCDGQTAEQRIEAATRTLGYFERSQEYQDFKSVLLTLLEVNGKGAAAAPLDQNWQVQESQIKEAYAVWFLIFHVLDGMKLHGHDPYVPANRCYLNVAPRGSLPGIDPKEVQDAQTRADYQKDLTENRARCRRNNFQMAWQQMDLEAQKALHTFLLSLSNPDRDMSGSYFAFALAKSGLTGARSSQIWGIFEKRMDPDWQPQSSGTVEARQGEKAFQFTETTTSEFAKTHLADWLQSGDPRQAAWAAFYCVRDKQTRAIPLLLAYLEKHSFDPVFEIEATRTYPQPLAPPGHDVLDAMAAVADALIALRARVPAQYLLQIAKVLPDQALILAILPESQESVLQYFYLTGGLNSWQPHDYYVSSGDIPLSSDGWMRWIAAGNTLVKQRSLSFAQNLLEHFTLKLHLLIASEHAIFFGGGPSPCVGAEPSERVRGSDWPPVGVYGLEAPVARTICSGTIPLRKDAGQPKLAPDEQMLASGGVSISITRRTSRNYGPPRFAPHLKWTPSDMRAHWLEALGTGSYGKGLSYDNWNPADAEPIRGAQDKRRDFQFYELITLWKEGPDSVGTHSPEALSEFAAHDELKDWIAAQHDVFQKVVNGLYKEDLISEGQLKRPLKIDIEGVDSRTPSAHSNVTFLAKAPFDDLQPENTELSWGNAPQ